MRQTNTMPHNDFAVAKGYLRNCPIPPGRSALK
jgi:hypothetical protein